jgi:outer membrane protein assembly factor BamB
MKKLPTTVCVLLFLALLLRGSAVDAADWPLPRGDAQATGSTAVTLPDDLVVRWEFAADDAVDASPVVAGGRVYIADVAGTIYCLDSNDGSEQWRLTTDVGFVAGPAIDSDILVIGDLDGKVYAVDTATGKLKWTHDVQGEISSGASFIDDRVLIASQDGNLYALARATGMPAWTYETSDQIQCSPSIAGDRTFLGGCDGNLHTVAIRDGKSSADPLPLGGPTGSTPAIVGERAFLPIMDGAVVAFDWKANRELWRYVDEERAQEYRTSAAVRDGVVVVASQNRQVDALDAETGQRKWRYTLRRRADASPVIAGEDVWLASTDGRLTRLSLTDGSEKWQFEIRGQFTSEPAIAGDRLFIADSRGVVRCFAAP